MSPSFVFFLSYVFPGFFIFFGGLALYGGIKEIRQARRSTTWPTAQGTIKSSGIRYEHTNKGGDVAFDDVCYSYMVYDIEYTSGQVLFGDYGSSNRQHAESIANQYEEGEAITVYYDPKNPAQAVLKPGLNGGCYFLPGFGVIFMMVGLFLILHFPKTFHPTGPKANAPVPARTSW